MKPMKRLFSRLRCQSLTVVLAVLLTATQCALELYLPWVMADIINKGVLGGDHSLIAALGQNMLIACVAMGIVGYGTSVVCARISQRFALDMRRDLYNHISTLSLTQVETLESGSLITRITADVAICASLINVCIMLFVEPVLLMCGGIYMMWSISKNFGLVFMLFVAAQLVVMLIFIRITAPKFIKVQKITDNINGRLQTTFSNFRLIKGFTTETQEKKSFYERNDNLFKTAFDVQKLLAIFNPLIMLLMNLAVVYILYSSGVNVSRGGMSVGGVVAAITYSEQILLSIMVSGQMLKTATEASPSASRIFEVMDTVSDMPPQGKLLEEPVRVVECCDVSYAYPESAPAIEHCNFRLERSEFVAMIGLIGAGKSTLSSLLGRFYDVSEGVVTVNGQDVRTLNPEDLRRHIAVVDRQAAVFEGTFADNICFGRDYVTEEEMILAARTAQCEEFILRQPDSYETVLVSLGQSISGGEKQRLIIARALAGRPDVLILDDSTSAMDYRTEAQMIAAIRRNYPQTAILLVTHRIPSAKTADKIAVFAQKRVLAVGTDAQLRENCEAYRVLCASQESQEVAYE